MNRNIRWIGQAVRWPNLVVMLATQWMGFFFLTTALWENTGTLVLLNLATLFTAAAGNIINDYFDLAADRVNKPEKVWIDRDLPKQKVPYLYTALNAVALISALCIHWRAAAFVALIIAVLGLYGWQYKRWPLLGNLLIAGCSAAVLWLFTVVFPGQLLPGLYTYALFAFLTTHAREVIKDMEDMEGDRVIKARTLPILFGTRIPAMLVVLLLALSLDLYYQQVLPYWRNLHSAMGIASFIYGCLLVLVPLMLVAMGILQAKEKKDYSRLSTRMKWVMLTGILSMIFL